MKRGATSQKIRVFVQDVTKAAGGLAGLAYNASGLTATYCRDGDSSTTTITLVAATLGTYTSGGFVAVGGGWYELGIPNAALTTGNHVTLLLSGAANMADCPVEIPLTDVDPQDKTTYGISAADVGGIVHGPRTVYYVSKDGSDSNDGLSPGAAFLTIGAAITAASSGDLIYVGPGVFDEHFIIPAGVRLLGCGRSHTRIEGSYDGNLVLALAGTSAEGISVVNTNTDGSSAKGMKISDRCLVRDCYSFGRLDGIFCGDNGTSIINTWAQIDHCTVESASDAITLGYDFVFDPGFTGAGWVTIRDTQARTFAYGDAVTLSNGLAVYNGSANVINCVIQQGNDDPDTDASGVIVGSSGTNKEAHLLGCKISGVVKDLTNSGGALIVANCAYDASKTSGTISVIDTPGNLTGDVKGKVLGGGTSNITGTGVRAVDSSGNTIAPASATTAIKQATDQLSFTAGKVNANATVTVVTVAAGSATSSNNIGVEQDFDVKSSLYWRAGVTVTALDSTGWTQWVWTLKADATTDADDEALLTIRLTNPGDAGDGLLVVNGVAAADKTLANLQASAITPDTTVYWEIRAAALDLPPSPSSAPYTWELTRWKGPDQKELVASGNRRSSGFACPHASHCQTSLASRATS